MAKKSRMIRRDLTCQGCGAKFTDHISCKYCTRCWAERKEQEAPKKDRATGTEVEVVAGTPKASGSNANYQKRIHVDRERTRYDARRTTSGDRSAARTKAADAVAKESQEERERKDPLRKRLYELREKRDELLSEADALDQEIVKVLTELGTPQKGDKALKPCYGQFDPGDFECVSLCPLRPECEVKTKREKVGAVIGGDAQEVDAS